MEIDEANRSDGHELCIRSVIVKMGSIASRPIFYQELKFQFRIIDQGIRAYFSELSILNGFQISSLHPG